MAMTNDVKVPRNYFGKKGTRPKNAILTDDQVRAIRAFEGTNRQCAAALNVPLGTVANVRCFKRYASVT